MKCIIYSTVGGTYSYHRDTKWVILYEALSNAYTTSCSLLSLFHFQNYTTTFHTSHSPRVHDNFSCWLRSNLTFPTEVHDTQGKDRSYLQETVWRDHHGQLNYSAFQNPKNSVSAVTFGADIVDGHSTVTGSGKPHNTAEKTKTLKSLSPAFIRR